MWKDGLWVITDEEAERDCCCRCLGCLLHWHEECESPPCVEPPPEDVDWDAITWLMAIEADDGNW